ncbi:MAG: 3-oxoacyl-ACP reductase FabG [Rhodospirillaceae bacterium]|nr:3-oxoacyl-ACP reductase FabG [Rhodospirillaceae bacterium]
MRALEGKVALVTGGSRGIGAATARKLAEDGADVALTYLSSRSKAEEVVATMETMGRRGMAIRADSRDASAIESAVARAVAHFGGLDILVNNAGVFPVGPFDRMPLEAFDEAVAVNMRAVFVASRAASAHMKNEGRIVTIGSNLAERVPAPGLSVYAATKAALIGLTKGMARDLGPRGITVNLVNPGPTDTDMNPENGPRADVKKRAMAIPHFCKPEDVAGLVAWLASAKGRFVTGAVLTIDSGANA